MIINYYFFEYSGRIGFGEVKGVCVGEKIKVEVVWLNVI